MKWRPNATRSALPAATMAAALSLVKPPAAIRVRPKVGNDMQQFFRDTFTPDRRDNAELGEVRSDRINHCGLLADEQMAGAVKHQATLLLRRLCWHEPHVGSGDRLANSLSIGHVVLLPFDVGFYIGLRHQPHSIAECLKFARPVARRAQSSM